MYNHPHKSEEFSNFLKDIPGILYWEKNVDSLFSDSNGICASALGFDKPDQILGYSDYEVKCGISEFAEVFRKNDRLVMESNKVIKFFEILHCADDQSPI